jgi:hypothetical protein
MLKAVIRLLFCILFTAVWCSKLHCQTIISLGTGSRNPVLLNLHQGAGATASWTQTNRFTNVTITAKVGGVVENPATGSGSAFLTRRIGWDATTNDELARVSFAFPTLATNVVLFTGLTLESGTWYLTIAGDAEASLPSWLANCKTEFTYADGVTLGTTYIFDESASYVPASDTRALASPEFLHFSVVAGTNGLPEERPLTPDDLNQGPVTREQSFTVRENESLTFRFDAFDPEGDPFEVSLIFDPRWGTVTAERFGSLEGMACFPLTELTYTPSPDTVGDDVLEYYAQDHTGSSTSRVLIKVLPPALTISCANGTVELQWTAKSPAWQVEFANSPNAADWETLDVAPVVEGDKLVVRAAALASPRFFRLQRF